VKAVLLALCLATAAPGAEPVYDSPEPPPAVYGPLVWLHAGTPTHGWWSTDKAISDVQVRLDKQQAMIDYLTDKAAKECVTETNAETRKILGASRTTWIVGASALLVGVLGGLYLGHRI
jgi:hypothetical protein